MVTCFHCQHSNGSNAFYCKKCGRPIACPRCRIILEQPLNFCDNCGQILAKEGNVRLVESAVTVDRSFDAAPIRTGPVSVESKVDVDETRAAAQGTRLEQFVPKELMAKLDAVRSSESMVGERRVVTILFCDTQGSTEAADQLDPEDWTEIINGAFEHMIKPVYQYEGTVARLTGDGILAFFGAPITHEDDPQRAILAALDIVAAIEPYKEQVLLEWGIEFNVRIGINTGRVVVGAVGSDLRMEYTAMGDAINMAARMEQKASPGTIQVAEDTYRLVAPQFEFEELGGIEVKGKSEPVLAYRVLKRKASLARMRGIEGHEIAMIGRDRELASLVSAVEDVQRGSGGIVCLMGEAGLGKSRLIRELQKTQANFQIADISDQDLPSGSRWFETASLSYETAQPYSLFRRLIRRIIGISHTDSQAEVREKLELLTGILPANSTASPQSVFETLFGLDDEEGSPPLQGEAFKRALFEVMPALWRQRFSDLPVVIVCDDLHWTDPASIALLHELLPLTDEMAIVFVCVFRPERDVPGWKIRNTADEIYHHRYTEINLHPLSESQSNEMIDALLGDPDLPIELRSRVLERAEGNPFYIEEVIRTLIDGEALIPGERTNGHIRWRVAGDSADIHIPDNLQALLTARIDGLTEEVRQTLQAASVIGRNFYKRVLKMIDNTSDEFDSRIQALLRQEMIRESARVPEIEYRFRNPLTQEAAYRTILIKRRREFHQRVGEVMESLFSEQLDEQAPQLAHHFREAHKYERAMDHFARAGDVAYRLFANEEAATHYGEALVMARKSKETISTEILLHLYMRRGRAQEHLVATEAAMENYQEMLAHAQENGEQKMTLSALMAMATLFSTQTAVQDVDRARELSEEALDLASSLDDKAAEATIYWNLMNTIAFADGDMDKGLAYGERSLKIARELDLKEQTAFTLNSMTMIYWKNNLLAQGIALLDEVRDLWRELDNQPMLADSYMMSGFIQLMKGDYRSALEIFLELERISLAINNAWNLSAGRFFLGLCFVEMGEIEKGFSYLNKTIEISDKPTLYGNELLAKVVLAGGYSLLGMVDEATHLAEETIRRIEDVRDYDRPLMFGLACAAFIRSGAFEQAKVIFEEISKHDVADGNAWFMAYIVGAEAEFALTEGRLEEAIEHIEKHLGKLYEFGVLAPLPYLLYLRSQAESRLGNNQSSKASLEQALKASDQNGERLWRWQILASLASVADSDGSQDAAEWRELAAETIDFVANNIADSDLHQAFLARPNVSALLETKIAK